MKRHRRGNYNGIVFRLEDGDFPMMAGSWDTETHLKAMSACCRTWADLHKKVSSATKMERTVKADCSADPESWQSFEIILPDRVLPARLLRILRDREPARANSRKDIDESA